MEATGKIIAMEDRSIEDDNKYIKHQSKNRSSIGSTVQRKSDQTTIEEVQMKIEGENKINQHLVLSFFLMFFLSNVCCTPPPPTTHCVVL